MRRRRYNFAALFFVGLLSMAGLSPAQEGSASRGRPEGGASARSTQPMIAGGAHQFWDRENVLLFTGVAATRAFDFTSTQHFRERGINEVLLNNAIADNKPLFAGIEAAGTAASIGVSYWLHRTGHHRAERWVSIVHIGVAAFGDIRNYGLNNPQAVGALH